MRNLFTFFVVAIIGLTSCEKSDINEDLGQAPESIVKKADLAFISNFKTLDATVKISATTGVSIIGDADATIINEYSVLGPDGGQFTITVKEALVTEGTPDTKSFNVNASVIYFELPTGELHISLNEEGKDAVDMIVPADQFEILG